MAFSEKVTTDFENRAKRQAESKTYVPRRLYNTVHVQSILQPQISSLFRFECKQLKHQ